MFTAFDIAVAAAVLLGGFLGFRAGAVMTVCGAACLPAGLWVSRHFSARLQMSPLLVLLCAAAVIIIAGLLARGLLKAAFAGTLDRLSGALFAMAVCLVGAVYFLPAAKGGSVASSYTAAKVAPVLDRCLPRERTGLRELAGRLSPGDLSRNLRFSLRRHGDAAATAENPAAVEN